MRIPFGLSPVILWITVSGGMIFKNFTARFIYSSKDKSFILPSLNHSSKVLPFTMWRGWSLTPHGFSLAHSLKLSRIISSVSSGSPAIKWRTVKIPLSFNFPIATVVSSWECPLLQRFRVWLWQLCIPISIKRNVSLFNSSRIFKTSSSKQSCLVPIAIPMTPSIERDFL